MKAIIHIPYSNGDAVRGFGYEGEEITPKRYVEMENKEYYDHKGGVDVMVTTSLGNNMAINNYQKRKINVKNQNFAFHKCGGNIRNIDGSDVTLKQLSKLYEDKKQFALYIYLDEMEFNTDPDLETDLKMWMQESQKIMSLTRLSDEEKVFHLPKKDFKIDFENGKSHAVLKNCKFAKLLSSIRKPVSKLCGTCGYKNEEKRSITEWICPECGTMHQGEPMITSFGMIIERIVFTNI